MGVVYYIKQHPDSNLKLLGYFLEVKFQSVVSYPYETMQVKKGLSWYDPFRDSLETIKLGSLLHYYERLASWNVESM